ncbi:hypothetical protein HUK68_17460 [Comamonas antarctica]|uniref:Uncharacterized protein n=1 Tax=Comamonas antarctica TaxID=2743470 RepID=A0A6N1XBG6_9BURK|nr:hypothetical protein HUK68_17460 [Comamonas antarctica]
MTLHLGELEGWLALCEDERYDLPLGLQTLVHGRFKNRMPDALALEVGIEEVEDAVMPASAWLPRPVRLQTHDALLHDIARVAGAREVLTREAVEQLFDHLARQAERAGAPDALLPQEPLWAAALLVLRECLHHWQVEQIHLEEIDSQ